MIEIIKPALIFIIPLGIYAANTYLSTCKHCKAEYTTSIRVCDKCKAKEIEG